MTDNPFAGLARIGWMEFLTHLKSPRLLILAALFALAVLGTSYGIAQPQTSPFGNQLSLFVHPAVVNESGVLHYAVVAYVSDFYGAPQAGQPLGLYRVNFSAPGQPVEEFLGQFTANESGFVRYDIGTVPPSLDEIYEFQDPGQGYRNSVFFYPDLMNRTFTLSGGVGYGYSNPFGSDYVVTMHILYLDGMPATGAVIRLNETSVGSPDVYGFVAVHVPQGDYTLSISYQGYTESQQVSNYIPGGPTWANGADAVLATVATTFMPLLLPIVAIAVSFDAVARERAQGSLELLLCRRVSRVGILAGKFLGAFTSVAVPVIAVLLAGMALISVVSGVAPTPSFAALFLASSLFLIAVYVLLMLVFSTLARSVGTAVVFGVVVWLFFNLLFSFLVFLVLIATGGNLFSRGFYETMATILLFDPNALYQMLLSLSFPPSAVPGFGLIPVGYLGAGVIIGASAAWVLLLFALSVYLFARRAES